jgi:predicted nucleotide-binding protein (sugar kinase/HSP70/actin superfamily)
MQENRIEFTKQMRGRYTILIPAMAQIHFELVRNAFCYHGYNIELLSNDGANIADIGLQYVHNDTCYPALLCIGQFIDALNSGKYDLDRIALMITQTGGGCRASNYIHLLRKALKSAGYGAIPVISLNLSGFEKNSGFALTLTMIRKALAALIYGDLLMLLKNQVMPYEQTRGESEQLVDLWTGRLSDSFQRGRAFAPRDMREKLTAIVRDFTSIKTVQSLKPKVGIVGEIYVKYSPLANNNLERFLFDQGCEVMVPGILAFMMFKVDNRLEDIKLYGGSALKKRAVDFLLRYLGRMEDMLIEAVHKSERFVAPSPYAKLKEMVGGVIGYGCKMGEGWLLTAEMLELAHLGYPNIVCAQPFGCLPNHIVGKGMIRKVREVSEAANIVAVDYDPGATRVNQENRIKLMLSVARESMERGAEQAAEALRQASGQQASQALELGWILKS